MFGSNLVKAGVHLHLLDKLTPEMRKTLAANKGMLNTFGQAIGQQGLFGPMAQKNLDQYNRGLAQMAASQKLLMTGAAGFGAGIAATAYTTSSFMKFEDDLAYIDTLRDESVSAMDIWGKEIRRLGGDTGKDIADISRSIYQSLSSSIPEDQVLDFVRVASKSSVAGRTSMENSVNALATVLNSYDLAVEKSMEVSDKLFYTVKRGRIEFDQLSNTIAGFAQSGSLAGISYEDLLASLATLTSVGISPDESSTSINRFLLSVISLSDEQKELGRSMGIDFNIAHMRKVGFLPFLQEISDAVDGDIEKLQKLFPEMRAFRAVAPLIGSANARFKDISEGMKNTAGATETAFSKMADTMQFDINRMKQNLESLKIGVGGIFAKELNPQLEGLVDTLGKLAEDDAAISRIAGAIKTITYSFGGLAGIGILGKVLGAGNIAAAGVKTGLSTGTLVSNSGGLGFLGSAGGAIAKAIKTEWFRSSAVAALPGGGATGALPASASAAGSGSIFGAAAGAAIVLAITAGITKMVGNYLDQRYTVFDDKQEDLRSALVAQLDRLIEKDNEERTVNSLMDIYQKVAEIKELDESRREMRSELFDLVGFNMANREMLVKQWGENSIQARGADTKWKNSASYKEFYTSGMELRELHIADAQIFEDKYWNALLKKYQGDEKLALAASGYYAGGVMDDRDMFIEELDKYLFQANKEIYGERVFSSNGQTFRQLLGIEEFRKPNNINVNVHVTKDDVIVSVEDENEKTETFKREAFRYVQSLMNAGKKEAEISMKKNPYFYHRPY